MTDTRERWNERYRALGEAGRPAPAPAPAPAPVLLANLDLLPDYGDALDLASGLGGNALLLAERGLDVTAWDISDVAIRSLSERATATGLKLKAERRDVSAQPPEPCRFDVIVVSRFLSRPLCPAIADALRPNGVLFYQTFVGTGPGGPRNPAFRLDEGELVRLFVPPLTVLRFEDPAPGAPENAREAWLVAARL